jgi:Fur family ferric uptake transcriptional regulator
MKQNHRLALRLKSDKILKEEIKRQGRPNEYESAIVSIIKEAPQGTHLTAPEVFVKAQELGLPVSISTVYRTLQRLKTVGDVSTVSGDRKIRYEAADGGPEHDHLICLGCGLTIEFIDERLPLFGLTVAKRKGFSLIKSRFDILGYCENCHKNSSEEKKAKLKEQWQAASEILEEAANLLEELNGDIHNDQLATLVTNNQLVMDNLSEALENCQTVDKLLNRGF